MRGCIVKPKGRRKSWGVQVYLGRDPETGKGKRKWFSFPTRKEAEAHLSQMLAQLHGGGTIPTTKLTVAEYLLQWLEKYAAGNVRQTSLMSYREIVHRHLIPALGRIPLRQLSPLDVQGYYTSKLTGDGTSTTKKPRPLAPATIRKHAGVLHEALEHAVKWNLLARNVCDLVKPPERADKEMRIWDAEQVKLFLGEARRSASFRNYALYLAALTTGARQGELLGLRPQDINFTLGTATIQQTLYRLGGSKKDGQPAQILFNPPKTKKSRRTVDLPPILVEVLRQLIGENEAMRKEFGAGYCDLGEHGPLVFCQPDGKPLHAHNIVRRDFQRVIKKAKVPKIRFHDMRHCHATDLLAHGEHPKLVSERLGHSSVAFTMQIYSHVLPGMQAQAVARLEERLFGEKISE